MGRSERHDTDVRRSPDSERLRWRSVPIVALVAVVLLVVSACTGDGSVEVVTEDTDFDAAGLAQQNAYGNASVDVTVPGAELGLHVEYFEALRKGTWTAPEHCWFSTRVSVADLESPGFDGPRSDSDTEAGEGVLAGRTTRLRMVELPIPPGVTTTTEGSAEATTTTTTTTTVVGQPTDEPDVPQPIGDAVGPGGDIVGPEDDAYTYPPYLDEEIVSAVVVVYGHDQVVELTSDAPGVLDDMSKVAQPLDGWNVLEIGFNPEQAPNTIPVTLRRIHADGSEETQDLEIMATYGDLDLLTPEWEFDLTGVDDSCVVPGGQTDNTPTEPQRDLLGAPVGDVPLLPEPGEQPADPAGASDEALASIRKVYDLSDIYSLDKKDYVENSDDYLVMREQLMTNDVVAPYMSNLDPVFRSIVFTSPTDAAVLYQVGPTYQWEVGRVLLKDGTWRVAAGTVCRDLAAAGYTCPDADADPPPGPLG